MPCRGSDRSRAWLCGWPAKNMRNATPSIEQVRPDDSRDRNRLHRNVRSHSRRMVGCRFSARVGAEESCGRFIACIRCEHSDGKRRRCRCARGGVLGFWKREEPFGLCDRGNGYRGWNCSGWEIVSGRGGVTSGNWPSRDGGFWPRVQLWFARLLGGVGRRLVHGEMVRRKLPGGRSKWRASECAANL